MDNRFDVALAASDDLYSVSRQLVQCALAHIACQHHLYAHLLEVGSNARLTSATLWRWELLNRDYLFIFNGIDCVVMAMTEVVVDVSITCG